MTFNDKSKSTSQFFYDLRRETSKEIYEKFMKVVDDYFSWYSGLQNKDPIKTVKMFSGDFVCSNRCSMGGAQQHSVVDLVIPKDIVMDTLEMYAEKYGIKLEIRSLQ